MLVQATARACWRAVPAALAWESTGVGEQCQPHWCGQNMDMVPAPAPVQASLTKVPPAEGKQSYVLVGAVYIHSRGPTARQ